LNVSVEGSEVLAISGQIHSIVPLRQTPRDLGHDEDSDPYENLPWEDNEEQYNL